MLWQLEFELSSSFIILPNYARVVALFALPHPTDREMLEFRAVSEIHFFLNAGSIRIHRGHADLERFGNRASGSTSADQFQNLKFPGGEAVDRTRRRPGAGTSHVS